MAASARAPATARVEPVPAVDLGAIQRQAFERGREAERREAGETLRSAAGALARALAAVQEARTVDGKEVEEFAVGLALLVAEELVGTLIRKDLIDVRGLVRRILGEVLPDQSGEEIVLEAHPDDLHLLPSDFAPPADGLRLRLVPEPRLLRGSFRVRGDGFEYWSAAGERLESMRAKLLGDLGSGAAS